MGSQVDDEQAHRMLDGEEESYSSSMATARHDIETGFMTLKKGFCQHLLRESQCRLYASDQGSRMKMGSGKVYYNRNFEASQECTARRPCVCKLTDAERMAGYEAGVEIRSVERSMWSKKKRNERAAKSAERATKSFQRQANRAEQKAEAYASAAERKGEAWYNKQRAMEKQHKAKKAADVARMEKAGTSWYKAAVEKRQKQKAQAARFNNRVNNMVKNATRTWERRQVRRYSMTREQRWKHDAQQAEEKSKSFIKRAIAAMKAWWKRTVAKEKKMQKMEAAGKRWINKQANNWVNSTAGHRAIKRAMESRRQRAKEDAKRFVRDVRTAEQHAEASAQRWARKARAEYADYASAANARKQKQIKAANKWMNKENKMINKAVDTQVQKAQ